MKQSAIHQSRAPGQRPAAAERQPLDSASPMPAAAIAVETNDTPDYATCPRCGADNRCALATSAAVQPLPARPFSGQSSPEQPEPSPARCWCMQQPSLPMSTAGTPATCYCAGCLAAIAAEARDAR